MPSIPLRQSASRLKRLLGARDKSRRAELAQAAVDEVSWPASISFSTVRFTGLVGPVEAESDSLQPEVSILEREFREGISRESTAIELGGVDSAVYLVTGEADT